MRSSNLKYRTTLIKLNDGFVSNVEVNDLFTKEVLRKRLVRPLSNHIDTIISIYELYNKKLFKDCFYKEAYIAQNDKDFFCNVLFDTQNHKFMLAMFCQPEVDIQDQHEVIVNILHGYEGIKESELSLDAEDLPETIRELITALTVHCIGPEQLRLKKIEAVQASHTIVFHSLSFLLENDLSKGLSILAGFQY